MENETELQQQSNTTAVSEPRSISDVLASTEFINAAKKFTDSPAGREYLITCINCKKDFTYLSPYVLLEWRLQSPQVSRCPECQKETKEKERIASRKKRWTEICPPLYCESDREKLPDESAKQSFDKIQDYVFNEKGLVVHGLTRRGKTRAVWQRMKKGFMATGIEPKFSFGGMFSLLISESFEEHETTGLIKSFGATEILFFDDIGQMIFTERVQECLFTILEMRCAYLRPTVFTMNDIGDTLKAKFSGNRGEAFVARLKEFCEVIKF